MALLDLNTLIIALDVFFIAGVILWYFAAPYLQGKIQSFRQLDLSLLLLLSGYAFLCATFISPAVTGQFPIVQALILVATFTAMLLMLMIALRVHATFIAVNIEAEDFSKATLAVLEKRKVLYSRRVADAASAYIDIERPKVKFRTWVWPTWIKTTFVPPKMSCLTWKSFDAEGSRFVKDFLGDLKKELAGVKAKPRYVIGLFYLSVVVLILLTAILSLI